eukprot:5624195-Amphidinium_carterae.1
MIHDGITLAEARLQLVKPACEFICHPRCRQETAWNAPAAQSSTHVPNCHPLPHSSNFVTLYLDLNCGYQTKVATTPTHTPPLRNPHSEHFILLHV